MRIILLMILNTLMDIANAINPRFLTFEATMENSDTFAIIMTITIILAITTDIKDLFKSNK